MSSVIKVENLGKLYRLGKVGTGTISHDLNRWFARIRGKEDPTLKLGATNDRTIKGETDFVWALKDINFEVEQGDVLGIIGKNGAGKSTLLKILSRTTGPTTGSFKAKGRIASLLEVGTGFHPELSGRENIFLNGAILGMTKSEIKSKFDEIVAFSGVERYIDTPVKRYSSGMYVRLAFAVAAHLEPEILIIDEVLAVGDAEFQEKCLGKMKDVGRQGRTVLFVSHNMPAVKSLCKKGLYLKFGEVVKHGLVEDVLVEYLAENKIVAETGIIPEDFHRTVGTGEAFFRKVFATNNEETCTKEFSFGEPIKFSVDIECKREFIDCSLNINLLSSSGDPLMFLRDSSFGIQKPRIYKKGMVSITIELEGKLLPGNYNVTAGFVHSKTGAAIDWVENVYSFKVGRAGYMGNDGYSYYTIHGFMEPKTKWNYNQIN